ncbi:MAG: 4Fe-4S binding protein, partial [Desulfovibrio sp.]|nr:4Fe-4S binding protein [Desulfovibrio sp.]
FEAITSHSGYSVDPVLCEGCGVCVALCPEKAIDFPEALCGNTYVSETCFGPVVHACLLPGQENSGKLVTLLKRKARELAEHYSYTTILCDGSPGIGCPVVSSLAGASLALAVVEPSLSGLHDFTRVSGVCRHFHLPVGVIINRSDLNPKGTEAIEEECEKMGFRVFGRIPFAPAMIEATHKGLAITEWDTPLADTVREMWDAIQSFRPSAKETLRPYSSSSL